MSLAQVAGIPVEEVAVLLGSTGAGAVLIAARMCVARTVGRRPAGDEAVPAR